MRSSLRFPWQLVGTHSSGRKSRNTWRFPLPCKMRPDPPPVTPEHSQARPRNSNGDLTFLRQHERLPEFPVVPSEESQASCCNSRHHKIPPSLRDEALLSYSTSRAILSSLAKLKSRLDSLQATQGGPGSPCKLEMKAEVPATT